MIKDVIISDLHGAVSLICEQERNAENHRLRSAYLYRGMPNVEYHLVTSLQRNCKGLKQTLEPIMLENFAKYAVMEEPSISASVWRQMIVGQHHGLPTRLLDWTPSPLVALHFANDETLDSLDQHDCVVWRINARSLNKNLPEAYQAQLAKKKSFIFSVDALSEISPTLAQYDKDLGSTSFVMIEPPSIDQRIINQYSFFSVIPNGVDNIEALLANAPVETTRFIIRKELRWDIRDMLDQFNINDRIIYPGLDGISKWIGRHYYVREE